ncbi:thioredoxin family protein [Flavivirga amylovorans]|uniref:Thioredoxin family protein n=1 Tax=Flavivirga amylovorans TaxID=870486 RepID=A0ABT8WZF9_9FLAO|nr:thioredoxin fold domain-containing protein [Flavivirga amylovorans]MDO5987059.1 thioredoxin family protein [Flavivirga amylovorans]
MKKNILTQIITIILVSQCVYGQGVSWKKSTDGITFEEVKALAKAENKKIFLDFFTVWCGPCKRMDKEIFSKEEIGTIYNENFINYKINAEKGVGVSLAKTFDIKAYPTYIYLETDGSLISRRTGLSDDISTIPAMLEFTKAVANGGKIKILKDYELDYNNGNRDAAFLKRYLSKYSEEKFTYPPPHLVLEWLNALPEIKDRDNTSYLLNRCDSKPGSKVYDYIIENIEQFPFFKEKDNLVRWLSTTISFHESESFKLMSLETVKTSITNDFPKYGPLAIQFYELNKNYRGKKKDKAYLEDYLDIIEKGQLDIDLEPFIHMEIMQIKNIDTTYFERIFPLVKSYSDESTDDALPQFIYGYYLYKIDKRKEAIEHIQKHKQLITAHAKEVATKAYAKNMLKHIEVMESGSALNEFNFF